MKLLLGILFYTLTVSLFAEITNTDICIYGGTAGGVAAAVEAARSGKNVVLLEFGYHLGGMSSGGLSQTDIGNKGAIGGISREFYQRMGAHYGKPEQWQFEPSVAEYIFFQFVNESKIPVYFHQRLASVKKEGGRITEITMENDKTYRAKMFIDATYEGDLMARAGVSYFVGREPNSQYNETLNGVRAETPKHQFIVPVDPYKIPPTARSYTLLPLIQFDLGEADRARVFHPTSHSIAFGEPPTGALPGTGDKSVQAYNFRLCLTQNPSNQIAIVPGPYYYPARYELLARYLEALVAAGKKPKLGDFMHIQMMPNGKTDINNNGGFSTDYIGYNYDYPDADYTRRAQIWQEHIEYTRGFLYFLATSPRVPEDMRHEMQSWGLAKDEFCDTDGWPHQLYIREARRMISNYVMTEHNCRDSLKLPDAIGLAAYTMDSHNCRRIVKDGHAENEGDTQIGGFPPYPIAYRSIVPKAAECENLLVPICLSSSHIAYGSIRMEPVFMVLGQSAATAACLAIDEHTPVQKVNIDKLQTRLLAEHQVLEWKQAR